MIYSVLNTVSTPKYLRFFICAIYFLIVIPTVFGGCEGVGSKSSLEKEPSAKHPGFQNTYLGKELSEKYGIHHPAIIAHRGASYHAPESTRPAYLLAREMGVDYLEIDVQRTSDNKLVVFHDSDLRPKTDIEKKFPNRADCLVSDFTWTELQQMDVGSWFNEAYPDRARASFSKKTAMLTILRFEDVLEIAESANRPLGLYIELKYPTRSITSDSQRCSKVLPIPNSTLEDRMVEMLLKKGWIKSNGKERSGSRARVIFQSFEPESLKRLKTLVPNVPAVLLVDELMVEKHEGWDDIIKLATQHGVGIGPWGHSWVDDPGWSSDKVPERYTSLSRWLISKFHRAGLIVHPWTINDQWEMTMVSEFGADGFFTDRPLSALSHFGRQDNVDLHKLWKKIDY